MRLLTAAIVLSAHLAAQTASTPTGLPTDADLFVAFDRATTKLSSGIDASTLTIPVQSGAVFPLTAGQATVVTIESEQIKVCSRSGNTLTACPGGRGFGGTSAASHQSARDVEGRISGIFHNQVRAELKAIAPLVADTRAYNFTLPSTAYSGDLTSPGAKTITLSAPYAWPPGVNAANVKHYVYISGGVGTAEAVLITGGTAVAGSSSGTLQFTTANPHSGASISSATAGMVEMGYANNGVVRIAAGTQQLRAPAIYRENWRITGFGPYVTEIIPASSSSPAFESALTPNTSDATKLVRDNVTFEDFYVNASAYPGINSVIGIKHVLPDGNTAPFVGSGGDTECTASSYPTCAEASSIYGVRIENVHFSNTYWGVFFERPKDVAMSHVRSGGNVRYYFGDPNGLPQRRVFDINISDLRHYSWCLRNECVAARSPGIPLDMSLDSVSIVQLQKCIICSVNDSYISAQSNSANGADGISFEGVGEDQQVNHTTIVLARYGVRGIQYGPGWPKYVTIHGSHIDQPIRQIAQFSIGTNSDYYTSVSNWLFSGNLFSNLNPAAPAGQAYVDVPAYSKDITFSGNQWHEIPANMRGIQISSNAVNIKVHNEIFVNPVGNVASATGLYIAPSATVTYSGITCRNLGACVYDPDTTVTAASTLTAPDFRNTLQVNGNTGITAVTGCDAPRAYRTLLLYFTGTPTITDGSGLNLAGNFTATAGSTLTLLCDGTTGWVETARSTN